MTPAPRTAKNADRRLSSQTTPTPWQEAAGASRRADGARCHLARPSRRAGRLPALRVRGGPGSARSRRGRQRGALRLCAPGESYSDIILRLAKT